MTGRIGTGTDEGTQVEQGLAEQPTLAWRDHGVDQCLGLGPGEHPAGHRSGKDPSGVGIDHADISLMGEDHDRPSRVLAHAGQGQQVRQRVRHAVLMVIDDGSGSAV